PTPPISPVERISQGKVSRCPFAQLTSLHDHLSLSTKRSTDFCHHVDEIGSATSCTASPRHQLGYLRTKQSSPTCKPRPTNPYFHPSDPKLPPSPDHELTFHNGPNTDPAPRKRQVRERQRSPHGQVRRSDEGPPQGDSQIPHLSHLARSPRLHSHRRPGLRPCFSHARFLDDEPPRTALRRRTVTTTTAVAKRASGCKRGS
ncbi:hypothetical protein EV126DRAFT_523659, partial [Verticillium dahliae]